MLVLSMHDSREYISRAIQYGARGYVLKDVSSKEIVIAIEAVNNGGTYFSSGVSEILLSNLDDGTQGPLTPKEQKVLSLVAEGKSNKLIARELDISLRTVETHRRNVKKKLAVDSTAGLTRYAIKHGLIDVSKV